MSLIIALLSLAAAEPADRVLAVVQEELVLASEVDLAMALQPHDPQASAFWILPRRHPEDNLIEAAMVRASAGEIGLYTPTDAEIADRLESIRDTFDSPSERDAFLTTWGLTEAGLLAFTTRRVTVERYLRRNIQVPSEDAQWEAELERLVAALRANTPVRRIREQD